MHGLKKLALWATALLPLASAAPVTGKREAKTVEGKYIVTLKSGLNTRDVESHITWIENVHKRSVGKRDGTAEGITKTYDMGESAFKGYAGSFDEATVELIKSNPEVEEVEADQIWYLSYIEDAVSDNSPVMAKRALTTQSGATWGQGAVSHKSGTGTTYIYDTAAGSGAYAYVVDSGVLITHSEFGGRASNGYNALDVAFQDTLGHGTHVAGTIAGTTYGISKQANVIAVKVFDGEEGYTSDILDGFTWAVNDIVNNARTAKAAINMSLGGGYSSAFNTAVNSAYSKGVVSVVAAGNSAANAANYSPASAANAVTVGAVDSTLAQAYYSNYGSVLDLYGPGSSVKSSWIGSNSATNTISGTSMATPHITGLVLYLQTVNSAGSASTVISSLISLATTGKLTSLSSGSPNRLGYNGNGS